MKTRTAKTLSVLRALVGGWKSAKELQAIAGAAQTTIQEIMAELRQDGLPVLEQRRHQLRLYHVPVEAAVVWLFGDRGSLEVLRDSPNYMDLIS